MGKMNFYYVERFNVVDQKINGFFVTKAAGLNELLFKLESDDDFAGDTPYLPQIYGITEEQYKAFPYMAPTREQALVSYE
jgi:hypothetical protein